MRSTVDRILEWLLMVLMSLMLGNVLWQVVSRYLFQAPSSLTDELSRFALIWIGLLGAAYATGKGLHLAIDIVPNLLSTQKRYKLDILINTLLIIFAISILVIGGSRLTWLTFELKQKSAALEVPLGYVYSVLPISGLVIFYYCIGNVLDKIRKQSVTTHELL